MIPKMHSCQSERAARRTILLVEDEPFVREATSRILSSAGFEVLPTADAEEASAVYGKRGQLIDLVMTDLVLPGRSGRQLVQDLRRFSPAIVALLTSGYLETESDNESPETHTYYLAKPYSRSSLVDKIEHVLRACPRRRAATQAG